MNPAEILGRLADDARSWARAYSEISEALIMEGVPEDRAREEARHSCSIVFYLAVTQPSPPASLDELLGSI